MAVINCRNWAVFVERFIRKALNLRGSKSTIAGLDRKINFNYRGWLALSRNRNILGFDCPKAAIRDGQQWAERSRASI